MASKLVFGSPLNSLHPDLPGHMTTCDLSISSVACKPKSLLFPTLLNNMGQNGADGHFDTNSVRTTGLCFLGMM